MAKKQIRTKYIKGLLEDKENLAKILEESTKDSLDNLLDESVNKNLRNILAESDDSYEEEDATEESVIDDEDQEDDDENIDLECGNDDGECANGTCCDKSECDECLDDIEDCKDADGEYDLRGKDINTVLKILQSMDPEDGVRIVKNDNGTATVEPDGDEQEFIIDIEDGESEPNDFEDSMSDDMDFDDDDENMDGNDGLDFEDDDDTDFEDDDMVDDVDLDDVDFDGEDDGDVEDNDDGAEIELEIDTNNDDEDDTQKMNEGKVNLGYTDNYQKKTAMTMPHDKGDGEGDSRFDAGAPKGDGKRWVGTKGANGGNPYTKKTKQPMDENFDECGTNEDEQIFEVELESNESLDEAKHKKTRTASKGYESESDEGNRHVGSLTQTRNGGRSKLARETNESMVRKANAILAENKELKQIAAQIKDKLNEAVVINSSLAKVIKLVTENSTTRDEKINILNRFNKVNSLNESRSLYNQISNELKNAHSVNNNVLNNTLTEAKGQNKNMIVETNLLNQSSDLKEILDLQNRLMKL